jgi:4-hydroxy-tetrahydrodipicolinate reductase
VAVRDDAKAALSSCDVAIDFSVPDATLAAMRAAADAGVAYVTGTTGFGAAERDELAALARRIPIVHAPNFSVAVNVLTWLVREAARRLGDGYDAEIVELHHAAKRDAPSGTALHLAEAVAAGRGVALDEHLVLERAGDIGARPAGAIGVQTLRGGDNTGEHTVLFVWGSTERSGARHDEVVCPTGRRPAAQRNGWAPVPVLAAAPARPRSVSGAGRCASVLAELPSSAPAWPSSASHSGPLSHPRASRPQPAALSSTLRREAGAAQERGTGPGQRDLRRMAPRPARPRPRRAAVPGSGMTPTSGLEVQISV